MPDFTAPLSKGLDAKRKVFHGTTATLSLLDHARPNRRGYDVLVDVESGWHLTKDNELHIAESATVTREKLDKATAFGIYIPIISDPAKVWAITDDGRKAPTYPAKRIWVFIVSPTQEPFDR
jgi:hypothetical protein